MRRLLSEQSRIIHHSTFFHVTQAYRSACHYGDTDEEADAALRIASSAVYNRLMLFSLKHADGLFRRMLGESACYM